MTDPGSLIIGIRPIRISTIESSRTMRRVINAAPDLTEEAFAHLSLARCEVAYCHLDDLTEDQQCARIRDADAVIADDERWTKKMFAVAKKLKIVARVGAGFDAIDLDAADRHGIWVTNTPTATSNAVADWTIALILELLRSVHVSIRELKEGTWRHRRGRELTSMTVGVVGSGQIGRKVIQRVRGFDAVALAYDVAPDHEFARQFQVRYVSLEELLAQSDIVTLHCPLSEQTSGLINESTLKQMKPNAYLVNTARPGIVIKEDLVNALQSGVLGAAAIDVHEPKFLAPDDPFLNLDNVIATPWNAFNTVDSCAAMSITAAQEIVRVLSGEVPNHPVNIGPG